MQEVSGNIVDVINKRVFKGIVTIDGNAISKVVEDSTVTAEQFVIPGFIDAHVHVESSMLIPSEFARLAVCSGSVASISDPHEIGNVLGVDGVKYMINNGNKVPFKFYFGAPSCVPATVFETAGAVIDVNDIKELIAMPEIKYLAEMMNFPGVLNGDPEVMEKIRIALDAGKQVDGHAPGLKGEDAKKYIDAGISTDHECFTKEEALDKLKHGMKIIIREGSAAKNFDALISLLDQFPDMIMFCSDDKHPNDLAVGHLNLLAKRAVAFGCDTMNVLRACSYNVVKHYGLEVGLLQEGDQADFCIVDNLADFNVSQTYIDGKLVAENGETKISSVDEVIVNNFNCSKISVDQLVVNTDKDLNRVKVIEVEDGQLITKTHISELKTVDGEIISDVAQDVLKIVVVNRYDNTPPAIAFVKNFGLKYGALASSVAHDSHNIIAVGVSDEDICKAINLVIETKGGVSLTYGNEQKVLGLPVAGIMSNIDGYKIADEYEALDMRAKELGVTLAAPYMTMSFCALLVIPELKLSDKGLFDGVGFRFTSLFA